MRPVSASGPPSTNRPDGLIRMWVSSSGGKVRRASASTPALDCPCQPFHLCILIVLGRYDHCVQPCRASILVLYCDLGFPIRQKSSDSPGFACHGNPTGNIMRQHDRQRHFLGRFIAGVPHHHALVACAKLPSRPLPISFLQRAIHPAAMSGLCLCSRTSSVLPLVWYPASCSTRSTMPGTRGICRLLISPATVMCPRVANTSQATWDAGSCAR